MYLWHLLRIDFCNVSKWNEHSIRHRIMSLKINKNTLIFNLSLQLAFHSVESWWAKKMKEGNKEGFNRLLFYQRVLKFEFLANTILIEYLNTTKSLNNDWYIHNNIIIFMISYMKFKFMYARQKHLGLTTYTQLNYIQTQRCLYIV